MVLITDLPPHALSFPRDDYTTAAHYYPQPGAVEATKVVLATAARRATRQWLVARRTGKWALVDRRCFYLAVLDKVVQLNALAREHDLQPWPVVTFQERRHMAEDLVGIAYDLASAAMSVPLTPATRSPPPSKLQIPPPEKIVDKVLQGLKWFHMPGDSEHAYPRSMRSQFTLSSYCGRYTFSLEERIVGRQKPDCKSGQIVRRPARRKRGSRADVLAGQLDMLRL